MIKSIGKIVYKRNNRAKYLRITLNTSEGIHVTIPRGVSEVEAERFVLKKMDWIKKTQEKFSKRKKTFFDEETIFKTRKRVLEISRVKESCIKSSILKNKIVVKCPVELDIASHPVQTTIRNIIEKAYRLEAREIIPARVEFYAKKFGFKYNRIAIKGAKTRWGSCSSKNNLNFNLHLMRLPDKLLDYVVLHELCHLKEKNHGKNFWALLDKLTGDAKGLDKELKNYNIINW